MTYFDDKEKERQKQNKKYRRLFYISTTIVLVFFTVNYIYKESSPNQVTGFTVTIPESIISVKFNTTEKAFDSQIDSWSLKIHDTEATIIDPEVREYAETCRLFDGDFYY